MKPTQDLAKNLQASMVVFLVALPLSLGIAVASGAPVQAGLIAAIVGGVVVGLFGGAPLQVSGPAAGLTVMVHGFVQLHGLKALGIIVVIAGVLQMLMGILKLARIALLMSPAVLHAMLAGIGILITLGQIQVILGGKPLGSAWHNLSHLPGLLAERNNAALIVGLVTLTTLVLWNRWIAPRFKAVPGSLVSIVVGTVVSFAIDGDVARVSVGGGLLDGLAPPSLDGQSLAGLFQSALALTVVASAESLLCAVATDKLHTGDRADLDRELFGQGLGNLCSGLLGGLPLTGVIVRSSANIASGATHRLSAILHGVWIALFVLVGAGLLARLPMAALAALLVHVGLNLVKLKEVRKLIRYREWPVYAATLAGVVFINLLWGIGIGFGLALIIAMKRLAEARVEIKTEGAVHVVCIQGQLSFLSVPSIMSRLGAIPTGAHVRLRLEIDHLDHAALEAIRDWWVGHENAGGRVDKPDLDRIWTGFR